ncbi:MAG: hypothetical protein EZS28_052514, partial [Streblomastix strix]
MEVPSEYNIIGGLLGLGPDILLEILSELRLISNAVQFLGVCNKTHQLMNHDRFMTIIETLSYPIEINSGYPIEIINKDPDCVKFIDIDGYQKNIYKKKIGYNTISLVQVLDNGIWTLEAMFQNSGGYNNTIGIVRDSYDIPAKAYYAFQPHNDHIAAFCGKNYGFSVFYKGKGTNGNEKFKD